MSPLTRRRTFIFTIGLAAWAGTEAWYASANGLSMASWAPTSPQEAVGMAISLGYGLMPFAVVAGYARRLGRTALVAAPLCAAVLVEGTREALNSSSSLAAVPMMMAPLMTTLGAALLACAAGCFRRSRGGL